MSTTPPPRRPTVRRMLGVGALGLLGGALLGLFLQDLLATAFIRDGHVPPVLAAAFTSLIPVVTVATAVAAVIVDRRRAGRTARSRR
jgi:drug/metabolite transporter (DMT)-like permease